MSSIAVSKVVKTTTDDKDSYDVLLKGEMRFDGVDETFHPDDEPVPYSEMADIELKIKGIDQRKLLIDNKIFRIGAVKALTLQDIQTALSDFKAYDPYRASDHIIDQELWVDPMGDIRTRNEVRATFLDLEEEGLMDDMTFLQFLDGQNSVDEIYEDNPEMIQAIRLFKHGYDFWGARLQMYGGCDI